jgi:hypothetical protein
MTAASWETLNQSHQLHGSQTLALGNSVRVVLLSSEVTDDPEMHMNKILALKVGDCHIMI